MAYYDELDEEIDKEMGWDKDGKKRRNHSMRRGPDYWQAILRTARASSPIWRFIGNIVHGVCKIVFFPVISPLGYAKRFDVDGNAVVLKRSIFWRVADGIFTRVLLTPVILALFLVGVVYASTHPKSVHARTTPDSYGIYFKRVNLVSTDSQRLAAWYLPPLSAEDVALDPDNALRQKWPAVVLCHGLGASHEQYLPLAQDLHQAGFAVLMIDTRGQGESETGAVTYGLRERMDVLAAVRFLRATAYVDDTKVSVVGHDIGATAALQAVALDPSISAVVADGLWPRFEERAREIFTRPPETGSLAAWASRGGRLPTEWLAPLYSMTFKVLVRDQQGRLDPESVVRGIRTQPVLFVSRVGKEYAPVQDVLALAQSTGAKHDVFIENPSVQGDTERRICEFIVKSTGWKGPKVRGREQIEKLLKDQSTPAK